MKPEPGMIRRVCTRRMTKEKSWWVDDGSWWSVRYPSLEEDGDKNREKNNQRAGEMRTKYGRGMKRA